VQNRGKHIKPGEEGNGGRKKWVPEKVSCTSNGGRGSGLVCARNGTGGGRKTSSRPGGGLCGGAQGKPKILGSTS